MCRKNNSNRSRSTLKISLRPFAYFLHYNIMKKIRECNERITLKYLFEFIEIYSETRSLPRSWDILITSIAFEADGIACLTRFLWNLSKAQDDESCSWIVTPFLISKLEDNSRYSHFGVKIFQWFWILDLSFSSFLLFSYSLSSIPTSYRLSRWIAD